MKTTITAENYDTMAKRIGWLGTELTRLYEQMIMAKGVVQSQDLRHAGKTTQSEKEVMREIIELDQALTDANIRLTDLHLQNFEFDVAGVITELEHRSRQTDKSKMKKEVTVQRISKHCNNSRQRRRTMLT